MPSTSRFSRKALQGVHSPETDEIFLCLMTLSHPSILNGPLRIVANEVDIESRGETFTAFPFHFVLPDSEDGRIGVAKLVIDNVDRQIVSVVRGLSIGGAVGVKMEIVLHETPNVIEVLHEGLQMREITYDAFTVTGSLTSESLDREPFPSKKFNPSRFPALG